MWKPTGQLTCTNKSKVVSGPKPNLLKGGCTQKKKLLGRGSMVVGPGKL